MSRPPFSLSDDQARELLQRISPLLDRFPVDPRDHRPFLRGFLRAVHAVTGKLYGPDVYRRLLRAYAPGRNPSTTTIATERQTLEHELVSTSASTCSPPTGPAPAAPTPVALELSHLRTLFDDYLPQFARLAAQVGRDTQVEYLQTRLRDTERAVADAKAYAARLAGEIQAQTTRADLLASELDASRAALSAQRDAVALLSDELKGQRLFAMQSIDMARGETRMAKDRAAELQATINRLEVTIDQLRMVRGASGGMR